MILMSLTCRGKIIVMDSPNITKFVNALDLEVYQVIRTVGG